MLQSESINELALALSIAQGHIGTAAFDKTNPHFKNQYASYDSIRKACQKALSENGLCITQMLSMSDKGRILITQVSHKSGQWIRSEITLPQAERETPQAIGSSITYAKRYALAALLCIGTGEDDDGEEAQKEIEVKPEPIVFISPEEARKIEAMIKPEDAGYRAELLQFLANRNNLYSARAFTDLPAKTLPQIYSGLNRRYEVKK